MDPESDVAYHLPQRVNDLLAMDRYDRETKIDCAEVRILHEFVDLIRTFPYSVVDGRSIK